MDIHFRASDIPVQTQGWLATLSHTLSFVTTPTPGQGGVFLYYIALFIISPTKPISHTSYPQHQAVPPQKASALSFHVRICHLELR